MAYLNFGDQLTEARRRSRLQGRPLSQQEAAGITEGSARAAGDKALAERSILNQEKQFGETMGLEREKLGTQKTQFGETLGLESRRLDELRKQFGITTDLEREKMGTQREQFKTSTGLEREKLGTQKEQFAKTLATQKEQFAQELVLKQRDLSQRMWASQAQLDIAKADLEMKRKQYDESSATQKAQFDEQMKLQIKESERKVKEWEEKLNFDKYSLDQNVTLLRDQMNAQIGAANRAEDDSGGGCCIIASVISNPEWYPLMTETDREVIDRAKADLITGNRTTEEIIAQCKDAYGKIGGYAVSITRIYRDTYMPKNQLRGYYMVAEMIVPRMLRAQKWMEWARRNIVDNVVPYCEWRIGICSHPPLMTIIKAKAFLWLCSLVGSTKASFTRCNGEVF